MADQHSRSPVRAELRKNKSPPSSRPYHHGLAIERTASVVMIKLTCENEYAAIELYERLAASATNGNLKFELNTTGLKQR